jgi:hypothetical protein
MLARETVRSREAMSAGADDVVGESALRQASRQSPWPRNAWLTRVRDGAMRVSSQTATPSSKHLILDGGYVEPSVSAAGVATSLGNVCAPNEQCT